MNTFWSPLVNVLKPYIPGEQPKNDHLIKLNTNENPYGPSPNVLSALNSVVDDKLRLYPDPNASQLKSVIANNYEVKKDQVFVGNGSDEVLAHIFNGLLNHDQPLLFPDITYGFYVVYCRLYRINYEIIPLTHDFEINVQDYVRSNGGIIFPNPNAPTGILQSLDEIEYLVKNNKDSVVVIDEAYIDFGGVSAVRLVDKYPNLIVVQTLSKSRSLAGLRVGYAIGNSNLIDALERLKNSFNSYPLNRFSIAGSVAAISDADYLNETTSKVIKTRQWLIREIENLDFTILPSMANFIFARHNQLDALPIFNALREDNIIVRHFRQDRIKQFVRITIGTTEECKILITTLEKNLRRLNDR